MRIATGTEPVSTTTDRTPEGSGLLSVITRKPAMPRATAPRVARVPTTSTTAAAINIIRNAVRPPGESGGGGCIAGSAGGGVAGAGGGGAMVVTVKALSVVQDSR
jgi:hypothetical protein